MYKEVNKSRKISDKLLLILKDPFPKGIEKNINKDT